MRFAQHRITKAFKNAPTLTIKSQTKLVILSDCHRGDGSRTDNFLKNYNLYYAALTQYHQHQFTYIELGDGDELWENRRMGEIEGIYEELFSLLACFQKENRLYMLYGNHDLEKKSRNPYSTGLKSLNIYEGILLRFEESGRSLFLVHGHQADFLNSKLWKLARFLVRSVWRKLEMLGVRDPTSAAKNYRRRKSVERSLMRWARNHRQPVLAGHTHRPVIPAFDEIPYFNAGSTVHPHSITAMEIVKGKLTLVKWSRKTRPDGTLYVGRDILAGPVQI